MRIATAGFSESCRCGRPKQTARRRSEHLPSYANRASTSFGGELTVESFEQLVEEIASPPKVGSALMVTRISMDPSKIDENVGFFKSEVLPRITAAPGFLVLRHMMDRKTGRGVVGSAWADKDAMKNAAAQGQARRDDGRARGVSFDEDSYREIVFADVRYLGPRPPIFSTRGRQVCRWPCRRRAAR